MSIVPNPVAQWPEPPSSGAALTLAVLVPYKTTAGYWIFVPRGTQPAGAVEGALVHGTTYDTLVTSTTAGLRVVRSPSGALLFL
jgi:hypothetical protein